MRPATSSALVTSGLYNVSRNPMYLAMILMLTALAFYLGALLPGLIVIGLTIYFLTEFQIKPEEEALEALFEEEYRAYKARVRRWI